MCQHLAILAHISVHRLVAQCEHGAMHVSWDITTLRLRRQDFMTVAQFLGRWGARQDASSVAEGWCQLTRDRRGAARLWIGQVGLALAEPEMMTFTSLVQQAATMLRVATDQPVAATQTILRCPVLTIDASALMKN